MTKKLSLIIPLFNEENSLRELHGQINAILRALNFAYEIIYIDDGSDDQSLSILKEIKNDFTKIIELRKNFGKSMALSIGFEEAEGDLIITMDADLQDDPSEIPNFIKKIEEGYDLISGWKRKRQDNFIKKISSKCFNFTVSKLTGLKLHDYNCGFKIYRQEVIKNLNVYGELHRFLPVLAFQKGFKIGEIEVSHSKRKYGLSKYGKTGFKRIINYLIDPINILVLTKYAEKPAHFFGKIGFVFLSAGFLINLYLTGLWFLDLGPIGNRPLLFLGVLLVIVGIQFISLGFLGELFIGGRISEKKNIYIKHRY